MHYFQLIFIKLDMMKFNVIMLNLNYSHRMKLYLGIRINEFNLETSQHWILVVFKRQKAALEHM